MAAADLGASTGLQIEMLPGIAHIEPPAEPHDTFVANAAEKAAYYSRYTEELVFADDSGLCVDALGGAPGVYSARYSGVGATDAGNLTLLLQNLKQEKNRKAHFVCVIAVAQKQRVMATAEGRVPGVILENLRGTGGFGYDPIFYYPPFDCTFAEISGQKKWDVSHRGQAFRELLKLLPAG